MPPARRFAILTCMDARLDPAKFAGLSEGDAHVIRNAGGRASDDAIRSLVISYKLLGTREWFVIHHTDCGMEFFTNEVMRSLLRNSLETAELTPQGFKDVGTGPGSVVGDYIEWHTIADQPAPSSTTSRGSGTIRWCRRRFRIYGLSVRRARPGPADRSGSRRRVRRGKDGRPC